MNKLNGINLEQEVINAVNEFLKEKFKGSKYYEAIYDKDGFLKLSERNYQYIEYKDNQFWVWGEWGNPIDDFKNVHTNKIEVENCIIEHNKKRYKEIIKQLKDSLDNFDEQSKAIKILTQKQLNQYEDELKKI